MVVGGLESHLPREQTIVMQTRFLFLRFCYPSCTVNYYSLLRCGGTTSPSLNANAAVSCIRRSFGRGRRKRLMMSRVLSPGGWRTACHAGYSGTRLICTTGLVNETPHRKWREIDLQPSCWLQLALAGWCLFPPLFPGNVSLTDPVLCSVRPADICTHEIDYSAKSR